MKTWIIIPCYNEAGRLDTSQIEALLASPDVNLVLVNDGSTDDTRALLESIREAHPGRVELLRMIRNMGKAEAVRRGMAHAIGMDADLTGYLDADFATPANEMLRLVEIAVTSPDCKALLGSRWLHLGAHIERSAIRHYTGRAFATLASMILKMPVYDTQCGAKLFRVTDTLVAAIGEPFFSRWAFDVELIGRLRAGVAPAQGYENGAFEEVSLNTWIDVQGSKIGPVDMIRATLELFVIASQLHRLQRENSSS